jgi:hypothetical protein
MHRARGGNLARLLLFFFSKISRGSGGWPPVRPVIKIPRFALDFPPHLP